MLWTRTAAEPTLRETLVAQVGLTEADASAWAEVMRVAYKMWRLRTPDHWLLFFALAVAVVIAESQHGPLTASTRRVDRRPAA